MKNKNILYCFTNTFSSLGKRLVFDGLDAGQNREKQETHDDGKEKGLDTKKVIGQADRFIEHLIKIRDQKVTDLDTKNESGYANFHVQRVQEALHMLRVTDVASEKEPDKYKEELKIRYYDLVSLLDEGRKFAQTIPENKEERIERNRLLDGAKKKFKEAIEHFQSGAVVEKNEASLWQTTSDFMDKGFWNLLNEKEQKLLMTKYYGGTSGGLSEWTKAEKASPDSSSYIVRIKFQKPLDIHVFHFDKNGKEV